ncbi:5-carboxymethyl-2-hydroxymuconate semialdehyde dehydrogenase [Novosphingobium beihaiensis]|uniref:5-carboxymethyl-2-hydroxymuconate semialdehyde dehydrogenase n=1 Tax=Novosphingobium beihaiensis TaxID=2930389 RepID=A0ABT0BLZ4_9SPHN|nr:5-carboxymethyl-2-hydroxymuconate semialdehyde dehydrogenase [Novosphingobium beihaiensis]MCJ2185851.1 5-carboxymethyl-2-hydroxymuconate semialdehyde dehydrogenase [Novosphingobium beihaiensis]
MSDKRDLALAAIAPYKDAPLGHFIGAQSAAAQGTPFDVLEPGTGQVLGQCSDASEEQLNAAVAAAKEAFPGWVSTAPEQRRKILNRVADLIVENADRIAAVECLDAGQCWRFMSKAAIRGAENFRFFADRAPGAADGQSLPAKDHVNYTTRRAIGPVGVITPWNTPFMLSTWKIAPALAAGCTVVHKPAEWSPYSARLLVEIAHEAGLPAGVFNSVNGLGETTGKRLTEHPDIKAVAFVGESSTGSAIMRQGAATLKRVHFELGGKNPVVVFDDADIESAIDAAVFMIYSLNGQRCTSSSRLLVQSTIYDQFVARVAERVNNLKVGDPFDPASEVGPLIHPRHFAKVSSYMDIAREDGARIAAGGAPVEGTEGFFFKPTLFADASQSMRIAQEEIFGPVLTAIPFDDEADAIAKANDVEYGLAGYLWTSDLGRALRVSEAMEAGMVWVNSENVRHLPTPFGGVKASGIGRDGGDWSFDFYMETKNIALARGTHKVQRLGV